MQFSTVSLGTNRPAFRAAAERVDLTDGDRDIGVAADRLVAPAPLGVLGVDDQADGLLEFLADLGPMGHAVGFGQEQRPQAVRIHRPVGRGRRDRDEARGGGVVHDVGEGPVDLRAVRARAPGSSPTP